MQSDINLAIGAAVAETLYGKACPILAVPAAEFRELSKASYLHISHDGTAGPSLDG